MKPFKPYSTALLFIITGSVWYMVGTIYGLFSAIHLVSPEFFANIPALVFSRARPVHVNTVLYGFVASVLIGCGYYYVPALLRTPLWSEPVGWASCLFWNLAVLSGPISFGMGYSQGREYAEYIWIADVSLMLALLLSILNLVMTILNRVEKYLYISVWYMTGTFLWTSGAYFIGNVMWHPRTGALSGILDPIVHWFWGHNLPGLLLTPLATGAAYFVVPRVVKRPLYSHALGAIGFWTLVAFYTHIGGHHIVQGPIPNWIKVASTVSSMTMAIPVFTVLTNLWMTARGAGGRLLHDPTGRLVLAGLIWYLITCIQGPLQSLPYLQPVTHFNNWTVGHAHIAVLGFSGFIAVGTMWHVLPMITGRRVYSPALVNLQFGLLMLGLTGFFLVLTAAGLVQGSAWNNGELVYKVLPELPPYMGSRLGLGLSIIASSFIGFYNLVMTLRRGEPVDPDTMVWELEEIA